MSHFYTIADGMKKNILTRLKTTWPESKSPIGIEQQALIGMITLILTRLFLADQQVSLGLEKIDHTQDKKYK